MRDKTFVLFNCTNDLAEFREFLKIAARLKAHGRVQVNVSSQADKGWFEIPEGGSPWHEYACNHPALWKIFPHEAIAPFLPRKWVEQNQRLLQEKVEALQEHELEAFFWTSEPHHMPEPFFLAHPHLRGPRVDHPRRSRVPAFSMCVDHPEALEMVTSMAHDLREAVPDLKGYMINIDDAGSGLCWSNTLYCGPNGPTHCRDRSVGQRMQDLLDAVRRGIEREGTVLDLHVSGNIPREQQERLRPKLPEHGYLHDGHSHDTARTAAVSNGADVHYPAKGFVNPMTIYAGLQRLGEPEVEKVFMNLRCDYDRDNELLSAIDRTVSFIEDYMTRPVPKGKLNRIRRVTELAATWSGEAAADTVTEAFMTIEEAQRVCDRIANRPRLIQAHYCGIALRYMTRPLVIKPDLLTPEEEAYFLPYVFNIHVEQARQDYIDFTGTRMPQMSCQEGPDIIAMPGILRCIAELEKAASDLEAAATTEAGQWLAQMAMSLRIKTSILRSFHNFYCGQMVRDAHAEELSGEPRLPEKVMSRLGEPGNLAFKHVMRDELDNTERLISLLQNGGLELLGRAKDDQHTDIFLLEPDVLDSLKRKTQVMLAHWRDIDDYLASPMK